MTKYAVITGASGGLGSEFAKRLANEGYSLILVARRLEELNNLASVLPTHVDVLALDLTYEESRVRLINYLSERQICPDLLINNAGFGVFSEFSDVDSQLYQQMIALNIAALTDLSIGIGSLMKVARQGTILNIASIAAFCPCPHLTVYGATKAYVLAFSENLSSELKPYGVQVAALCPGPIETAFWSTAGVNNTSTLDLFMSSPDEVVSFALKAINQKKVIAIPGKVNNLLYLLIKILPRGLSRKISEKILKKLSEKN